MISIFTTHRFEGNASIWTATVLAQPKPGELLDISFPAVGNAPERTERGWVSSDQRFAKPGTTVVLIASGGSVYIEFEVDDDESLDALDWQQWADDYSSEERTVQEPTKIIVQRGADYDSTGLPTWDVFDAAEYNDTSRRPRPIGSVWIAPQTHAITGQPVAGIGYGARWALANDGILAPYERELVTEGVGYPGWAATAARQLAKAHDAKYYGI